MIVFWRSLFAPGVEELRLDESAQGVVATGVMTVHRGDGMIAFHDDAPFRVRYRIECDAAWRVRAVHATAPGGRRLDLEADGSGRWRDRPDLDGAIDVDIAASGFTNTLTIRRLALPDGASREERVVYVAVPSLTVAPVVQRYTRLDATHFRYENLTTPYVNDIEVDAHGLVVDYPGILTRLTADQVAAVVEHDGAVLSEPVLGRVEPPEPPDAAITRVVKQATGLTVDVVAPLDASERGVVFQCRVRKGFPVPSGPRWIPRAELPAGGSEPLARFAALAD